MPATYATERFYSVVVVSPRFDALDVILTTDLWLYENYHVHLEHITMAWMLIIY